MGAVFLFKDGVQLRWWQHCWEKFAWSIEKMVHVANEIRNDAISRFSFKKICTLLRIALSLFLIYHE